MTTIESEDILARISSNDLLVETILSNFSAKQLQNVGSVCKRWKRLSVKINRNRVNFETFLMIYDPKGFRLTEGIGQASEGKDKRLFLNYLIGLVEVYKSDNENSVVSLLECYFNEKLFTIPALGIMFTSSVTLARKLNLKNYLPRDCHQIVICAKAGIIGQPALSLKPIELEKYHFKLNAISGSFVPRQWADFKVTVTDWMDAEISEPNHNDPDYPVKCLIILSINFEDVKRFNSWLSLSAIPIPIGGALVDRICYEGKEVSLLTITFSGTNLKAASFILDSGTPSETETKLINFKRALDFDVDDTSANIKTLGFLFICAGRGAESYRGNLNVESNIINKVFPHVPFSGVFGNGEYGWNCYNQPEAAEKYKTISQMELGLNYTTVLILLQFNRTLPRR